MTKPIYYDGTKLLSMKDINGGTPEIFMTTSNRSAGKTTYFGRMVVNRFNKNKDKFAVLYRFNYELDDCANKFYKDIGSLFFKGTHMTSISRAKGIYHDLFIDEIHCGYALSINSADQIKKYSHLFSDVSSILFDEFQSETNHYCSDEVNKFRSIHTSIARGQGEQVRYVPVYMISNPVSIINPYYVAMGISARLDDKTRFLKGNGFVLEQGFNESAANAQKESAFNSAFADDTYNSYLSEGVYLNDNLAFIEKPNSPKNRYVATIRYKGTEFAIREYSELGILYCDTNADSTFPMRVSVTTEDHNINWVMLKRNDMFISNMRYLFERGAFRFKDLRCKEAIMNLISY